MNRSETLAKLTEALAKAQGNFAGVKKSGHNPQLKNNYATLDDVIAAVRSALSAEGLSVVQPLNSNEAGAFVLETVLLHTSGEWLSCSAVMPEWAGNRAVNTLQQFGGALTYMRRYMLTSLLGINADEDADGNSPARKEHQTRQQASETPGSSNDSKPPHWIDGVTSGGKSIRSAFWAWTGEQGLSNTEVYEALSVEHIHDYPGTMGEAKAQIEGWINTHAHAVEVEQ